MTVKPGDTIETAIWLTGTETPDLRRRFEQDVERALKEANEASGAVTGPLRWLEKLPGTERVPPVPGHITGPHVRLLVAEADVLAMRPAGPGAFLAELEPRDLKRLRNVTRKAHVRWCLENLGKRPIRTITDRQADTLINDLGPEAAIVALQRGSATLQ